MGVFIMGVWGGIRGIYHGCLGREKKKRRKLTEQKTKIGYFQ